MRVLFRTDKDPALLVLRVALGAVMFAHGSQKVLGWFGGAGFEKTVEVFTGKMGFPFLFAVVIILTEFLGSIGLIAGFLTRISAVGIGAIIGSCAYMNHLQNGFFMNWFGQQKGEGFEFHILVLGIVVTLVMKGGGLLSVDRKIAR